MVKFNVFNIKLGRCYKRAYTLVHALIRVPTKVLRDCHKLIRKALLAVYFCSCGVLFYVFNSHGVNHGSTYRRYAYRYNAKKERGTSMEVFARNENHKGAMMNV